MANFGATTPRPWGGEHHNATGTHPQEMSPASVALDLTAGALSWLLVVLANRFLLHRVDSHVEEAYLAHPTSPSDHALSFGTATSGATSAIASAMTTPVRAVYDEEMSESALLGKVGVLHMILGDPKCWVYCASIAVGLMRSIYFAASTALASVSRRDSDQLSHFNSVQDAASAPVIAVYYSALLLIGWTIFEGYVPSDYFRTTNSPRLHWLFQRRIRISVFLTWLLITVAVVVELLWGELTGQNSTSAYTSSLLAWVVGLFYAFQAVVVPRQMFSHGLRSSGVKLRAVTVLVSVTLLVRGTFIFPPIQMNMQGRGFNEFFTSVMAMWDVFALAACLVILNARQ